MKVGYLAVDQYGHAYVLKTKRPRKELLSMFAATKARKMYRDNIDGTAVEAGYVVKNMWLSLYQVHTWK